jgi:hypothetical protein
LFWQKVAAPTGFRNGITLNALGGWHIFIVFKPTKMRTLELLVVTKHAPSEHHSLSAFTERASTGVDFALPLN